MSGDASTLCSICNSKSNSNGDGNSVLLDEDGTPTYVALTIDSVWNDRYVEKVVIAGGKQGWKCDWCNVTFKTKYATRIICRLLKIRRQHIAMCKAIIPAANTERYQGIQQKSL